MKIVLSLALLIGFCSAAGADTATQPTAAKALKAADAAAAQADQAGVQWTSTVALLKAAHAADATGDFATAQAKAAKAEAMAKLSIQEAHEQAGLWPAQVIK